MKILFPLLSALIAIVLYSCASSTLYGPDGKPIFQTQANMTNSEYVRAADGSVRWTAATVDHSTPTAAGGESFRNGALAAGTAIATSRVPSVVK